MALQSKTFSTTSGAYTLYLVITEESTNVVNNTSYLTYRLGMSRTSSNRFNQYHIGWNIALNGAQVSYCSRAASPQIGFASGVYDITITSGSVTVSHNSDGSLNMPIAVSIDMAKDSYGPGAISLSGTMKMTDIPRASSLTASNGTLGTAQTLTVTRHADSFTHTITYACGDKSGTIATKSIDTSISWTPPVSLATENTTGTSVSVTFTITTYSGNTNIGSNTKTITCSIPSSVAPFVSIAVSDAMEYSGIYGAYVQGKSKIKIVITASGSQGSTIKSYSTTADGKSYTTASITTDVISGTGNLTVTTTVKDSRGRSATASQTISVLAYTAPKINSISAFRSDSNGTANTSGAYLAVKFSSTVTALNNHNTATYQVKYKKSTALSYTTATISGYANQYSVSSGVHVFAADTASSYDITLTVTDAFNSAGRSTTGPSISRLFDLLKSTGKIVGIAFGKVSELMNTIDIASDWKLHVRGAAEFEKTVTANSTVTVNNTGTNGFKLCRTSADKESVLHTISDAEYKIKYTNDETNSCIVFELVNTDTETGGGTNANTSSVTFSSAGEIYAASYSGDWKGTPIPISNGGTGAATAAAAVTNLGIKDHVIAQGTSGIWTYRKWDSGIAEFWGYKTIDGSISIPWASIYEGCAIPAQPYPFEVTNATETVTASAVISGSACMLETATLHTTTQTGTYYAVRPALKDTCSVRYNFYVIGRWK